MSYSRGCGFDDTSCASRISSSVVWPIADSTATTFAPASRAPTSRCATRFSLSVSPTDVPPNFITTRPGVRGRVPTLGTASNSIVVTAESVGAARLHLAPAAERAAERDLVGVLEIAPDGKAAREAGDADA